MGSKLNDDQRNNIAFDLNTTKYQHFKTQQSFSGDSFGNEEIEFDSHSGKSTFRNMSVQRAFGLKLVVEAFRFRYIPLLFVVFVISQVLIFGFVIPRNCNYFMWLIGQCTRSRIHITTPSSLSSIRVFSRKSLPQCPLIPPNLHGKFDLNVDIPSWIEIEYKYQMLEPGGRYRPSGCTARHRVAIIIPFRDRDIHLKLFLNNIHAMLQRQQLDYAIYVVDLERNIPFNRALLLNAGYLEAKKTYDYQCYVFHDVDLIPENDHNLYSCPEHPRHMSVAIDKWNYKLPYMSIFGGVVAMSEEQIQQVNGFSNIFFGWGGEDDDMFQRIKRQNMTITRYTGDVARYHMLSHRKDKGNPNRFNLLKTARQRSKYDGINSLRYKVLKKNYNKLYTYILISVNQTEIMLTGSSNRTKALRAETKHNKSKQHEINR